MKKIILEAMKLYVVKSSAGRGRVVDEGLWSNSLLYLCV